MSRLEWFLLFAAVLAFVELMRRAFYFAGDDPNMLAWRLPLDQHVKMSVLFLTSMALFMAVASRALSEMPSW